MQFNEEVRERLTRMETKLDHLTGLEQRVTANEKFKYWVVGIATATSTGVHGLLEYIKGAFN